MGATTMEAARSMGLGIPDECPECGGGVELAEGFGTTLPYTCTECGNNFRKTNG